LIAVIIANNNNNDNDDNNKNKEKSKVRDHMCKTTQIDVVTLCKHKIYVFSSYIKRWSCSMPPVTDRSIGARVFCEKSFQIPPASLPNSTAHCSKFS